MRDIKFQAADANCLAISLQRQLVEQVFEALWKEYAVRRKMLTERAKVTLQSMLWSKEYLEVKGTLEEAQQAAQNGQDRLLEDPELQLAQVFNARVGGSFFLLLNLLQMLRVGG